MKIEENIDLYKFNTMRLHSLAEIVYFPENRMELVGLLRKYPDAYIFAAGSNVILPPKLNHPVISILSLDEKIEICKDGRVIVGCSVRIQKLIRFLQEHDMGGIEYLFSIPATVGGLVYMNGGRGKKMNMSISDYLLSVEYLNIEDLKVYKYEFKPSDFSYRHSPFQQMNVVILSCIFKFKSQDTETTKRLVAERMEFSKRHLSADKPSSGSIFKDGNRVIYRLLRGMKIGGAMFSNKTSNWISNVDNATYEDVCTLIKRAQLIHKLFLSSCETEVKIIK